ncbi:hypothetical protein D7Z26_00270 [Cohnella endophytica]|uniref:Uncharacterized protein n=1 Tax=Cohnella endophytica TaxID=2419778 RepID=A0A494Y5L6_9BACL|nr:hypothetical protein [Cohnella endophytica]RKP57987.1 hypothetical protein D7Z26_00270 [Cohnella endophytica]
MTKKIIIPILVISIIMLLVLYTLYTNPKKYSSNINGISYQLGIENRQLATPVNVQLNGYLNRQLNGNKKFVGSFYLKLSDSSEPEINRNIEITFDKVGRGLIIFDETSSGIPKLNSYGIVFINNNLSEISIMKYKEEKNDLNGIHKGWSGEDGFMISGPAENRSEAIDIANKLMKKLLNGYPLV